MMFGAYLPLVLTLCGTALLGVTAGVLGVFAILRGQSLLGDAVSHAALPGIAGMFLITPTNDPFVLMLGGAIVGILGAVFARFVVRYTRLKHDAVLGIVLSVFFGCGVILLTVIQKQMIADQAILGKFLFGNAATLLPYDITVLSVAAVVILVLMYMLWRPFKVITFDPAFAHACGYPVRRLDTVLTVLMVCTIVIGLYLVGVLLMSSLLIAPAAAARQWTHRMEPMAFLAAGFGVVASVIGTVISSSYYYVPTGPLIVITMSIGIAISLLFAPRRGLFWSWVRRIQTQK